ncbi:MAG: hypothetical protein NVSMB49_02360 [Ktedonobacteraceae bacterium]
MFSFISNIPIFRRLFLAFVLAAVIPGIIITILGITFVNDLNIRSQAQQKNFEAVNESNRLGGLLLSMNGFRDEVVSNPPKDFTQYKELGHNPYNDLKLNEQDFDTKSRQFQQSYQVATSANMSGVNSILSNDDSSNNQLSQEQHVILNKVLGVNGLWTNYKNANDQVLQDVQHPTIDTVKLNSDNVAASEAFNSLRAAWSTVTGITQQISSVLVQVGSSQVNPIILGTVIAFLTAIMVVIAIGYIVNNTITSPLRDLALLTRRIAKGETSARAKIAGHDEIHMVANSMNNMLDNIVRLIQETQSQRDVLQSQVEKLVGEVSGVGEGDLRIQAEVTTDALGVLADSFNYMVEELSSLIVRVKMVANEVDSSTALILDRMTQLVKTGDAQINRITESAIEVEHMAASSRQVAERSQLLYNVARVARQDAQGGRESLQQAVEGMGRINENVQLTASKVQDLGERSREIDEIVTAISSIAHQTNRLALDAAIQAAMAGENGKGFGAVAADIRRLAERAKEQVSSITKIVRGVREEVGAVSISMQDTERETLSGTHLAQEAGVALEAIFTAVEQQAREIENINKVAMQQLQSSSAVVQIMHGVSESTLQSSASTRDASQNMHRLTLLVEQLRSSVEAFKLREDQGHLFPPANILMEDEQDSPLTMSGIFRTISGGTQPAQLSSVGFSSKALPPARSDVPFSTYAATPNSRPLYNGNGNDFPDYQDREQWFNEQSFTPNGNNRNR